MLIDKCCSNPSSFVSYISWTHTHLDHSFFIYLLLDYAEANMNETTVEELIATSGKLAVLDKLLLSLFKKGHRTCIFSQFTSMLNILEDYCILRGWRYCRFDGGTPRAQRNHIINQFNAPGSNDFIFLMSTRSGGLGINLQTADTCM